MSELRCDCRCHDTAHAHWGALMARDEDAPSMHSFVGLLEACPFCISLHILACNLAYGTHTVPEPNLRRRPAKQ